MGVQAFIDFGRAASSQYLQGQILSVFIVFKTDGLALLRRMIFRLDELAQRCKHLPELFAMPCFQVVNFFPKLLQLFGKLLLNGKEFPHFYKSPNDEDAGLAGLGAI